MLGELFGMPDLGICEEYRPPEEDYYRDPWEAEREEDDMLMHMFPYEWRRRHPWEFNPVTGGWSEDEDRENGW